MIGVDEESVVGRLDNGVDEESVVGRLEWTRRVCDWSGRGECSRPIG